MPSREKKSYGSIVQTRACRVLKGILEATKAGESSDPKKLQFRWQEEAGSQKVAIETTLQTLMHITNQDGQATVTTANVREALEAMRDFLGIMQDHRVKTKGEAQWKFTLTLWSQDIQRNLNEFDKLWESKRSPKAKSQAVPEQPSKLGLKMGAPYPKVRLPDNFVPRIEAFDAVRRKLLAETACPLVVSAIAGLGGLGKSVLAEALVLDAEVQTRFDDGILLVRLGQNPDLQNLLGDWIRTLDKSRESYSATTLEGASNYLYTLLLDKRMLLVVDDVWNGAHLEHFRVGSAQCRMLVTTREAQIEGADYHALDVMTEEEAISLVRQKLDRQWQPEQEPEVKAFAKSLGYLPLALDLATNQVRDGLSWADLRSEFETERRAVALEVLDASEAWDCLDENQQRKYSLRACFNLSLRRLSAEQLRQFAWLGVLPEDVSLDARMAVTLWELSPLKAKKALIDLRNRSFLTSGTETLEGELTYRVHDLIHDTARGLIEQATLSAPIQTLAEAHAQLLDRYRQKCDRWDRLPNDGYIHRHLTWHLQQAGREDEIHALMAMSDEQGRNAWFEACDRLGQPAIFVQDVKRGWAIAEQNYEEDNTRSIVLQCRYALITATLNSLVANLPIGMMTEFVKHGYWTPEQAWAYVEQMQHEEDIAVSIEALTPYLPESIMNLAVVKARSIEDEFCQAQVLITISKIDPKHFSGALKVARSIQNPVNRASILSGLAEIEALCLSEALEVARSIQNDIDYADALATIACVDNNYLSEAAEVARVIQNEGSRADILTTLAEVDITYSIEAINAARLIQHDFVRARTIATLAKVDKKYFHEALKEARSLQDQLSKAKTLCILAEIDSTYFSEALEAVLTDQDQYWQQIILPDVLVQIASSPELLQCPKVMEAIQLVNSLSGRARILSALAQMEGANFAHLLANVRLIYDEISRARTLVNLAKIDLAYFSEALETTRSIQDKSNRAELLIAIAEIDDLYLPEAAETVYSVQDELNRTRVLIDLAKVDRTCFADALDSARLIQEGFSHASVLRDLAKIDNTYFVEALEAIQFISSKLSQTFAIVDLAEVAPERLSELEQALQALQLDQNVYVQTLSLGILAQIDPNYIPTASEMMQKLHAPDRASVLCKLAQFNSDYFAEALTATMMSQDEYGCASALHDLAVSLPIFLVPQALDIINRMNQVLAQAQALSAYLPRISLTTLSSNDWKSHLHLLAHRTRADLMQDLATLHPAIVHLGGKEAVRGMVDAMREVCSQWK